MVLLAEQNLTLLPEPQSARKVYIETLGCQMNKADSEVMLGLLQREGFAHTPNPDEADLLIVNTCQIRENAEDKAYNQLANWGRFKKNRPGVKIAMAGCTAQQAKGEVFNRVNTVDIVFGTQNIHQLPQLVRRAFDENEQHIVAVDKQKEASLFDYFEAITPETMVQARQDAGISAWVSIIEGCDYFCTYCVVPYTRGRQISRKPESIIAEVEALVAKGYKEVTLLGQTVDAYGKDFKDRQYDLAKLFEALNPIEGLERLRFTTSHPLDFSDAMIDAMANLPKVMPHIHIPMQSGDDDVLRRMRRGYTAAEYYALTDKLHQRLPDVTITSDYIVGFPGETEAQFMNTVYSVARSGIYYANTATYSARQQTPAAIWETRYAEEQAVPQEVKDERLQTLNEVIRKQAKSTNEPYVGRTVEVLVEGLSKRNPNRLTGRTPTSHVVNFDAPQPFEGLVGQLVPVRITEAYGFSLLGVAE